MTRRQAEACFDGLDVDEDVFAVQADEALRAERAEIESLLDVVDRELNGDRRARRAVRTVLRSLPVRLDVADLDQGESA